MKHSLCEQFQDTIEMPIVKSIEVSMGILCEFCHNSIEYGFNWNSVEYGFYGNLHNLYNFMHYFFIKLWIITINESH